MFRVFVSPAKGEPFERLCAADSVVVGASPTSDLVLNDFAVLRQHVRLFRSGVDLIIENLAPPEATLLNGLPLKSPIKINAGDRVDIGNNHISIVDVASLAPAVSDEEEVLGTRTLYRTLAELSPPPPAFGEATSLEELQRYAKHLELLNQLHEALGHTISLDNLLSLILERLYNLLRPHQAVILLIAEDGSIFRAVRHPITDEQIPVSRNLVREVTEKRLGALVQDARKDSRFSSADSLKGFRSMVAVPLLDEDQVLGIIVLASRTHVGGFTEDDLVLLASVASVAVLRIRNMSLMEESAERRRLEAELMFARQIQLALLSELPPVVRGYALFGHTEPSRGVSGDYYQFLELSVDKCVFLVADVSGKGMAAALLMASTEALASVAITRGNPLEEAFAIVSDQLFRRTLPRQFVTAFAACIEQSTESMSYVSAGHNDALVIQQDGSVERLRSTGLPLGMLQSSGFKVGEARIRPGATVIVYTDGITEAENTKAEEYGIDRLISVCVLHRAASPKDLAAEIQKDLQRFVGEEAFKDDRTIVIVRKATVTV